MRGAAMRMLPRVLVFDDVVGSLAPTDIDIEARNEYCRSLGLRDELCQEEPDYEIVADAQISGAQRLTPAGTINSLDAVREAFRAGWPASSGRYWSAALVDMKFGTDAHFGLKIIELLHGLAPELPIIVISSINQLALHSGEILRHAAERLGAQDFLAVSGIDFDVDASYRSTPQKLSERLTALGLVPDPEQEVIGVSLPICLMLKRIRSLIPEDALGQMLLLGQSGSGKTHLLGYVHRHLAKVQSRRVDQVKCCTVSLSGTADDMQSKSLLGTTSATGVKPAGGAFEIASDGGLVFLDEIGDASLETQSLLLQALQPRRSPDGALYRDVRRMGAPLGSVSRCFVLAATNRDVDYMGERNLFNEALLQRFDNRRVPIPTLSARTEDLPLLIEHFLKVSCTRFGIKMIVGLDGKLVSPRFEIPSEAWENFSQTHTIRQLSTLVESTVSSNRYKTLFVESDVFGTSRSVDIRYKTEVFVPANIDSSVAGKETVSQQGEPVSSLEQYLRSWEPTATQPVQFDRAFVRLDVAFANAKLRLWRELARRQKELTGSLNLLGTARQLLGRADIMNSKSGDLACKIFEDADLKSRPNDGILAEIWDRRRSKRKVTDRQFKKE